MNLTIKRPGEPEPMLYTVPDDYRVDEFYCTYNKIPEETSDAVVHERMSKSPDALCTENGNYVRFADHANSTTTLMDVGINGNEAYTYTVNTVIDSPNGGEND